MLAVVSQPHTDGFWMEGDLPSDLLDSLRERFGDALWVDGEDDDGDEGDPVDFHDLDWFKEIEPTLTPASNLKFYRELNHLTQKDLAEMLGVGRKYVSDMEHERRPISLNMAKAISEALDAPLGRFI